MSGEPSAPTVASAPKGEGLVTRDDQLRFKANKKDNRKKKIQKGKVGSEKKTEEHEESEENTSKETWEETPAASTKQAIPTKQEETE